MAYGLVTFGKVRAMRMELALSSDGVVKQEIMTKRDQMNLLS